MRQKVLIQSLKWFLPLLFIFFINGKVYFTHSHLENNSIVIHTHPFKKGENKTHNHTTKELIAIAFHTHSFSTNAIIPHIEINSPIQFLVQQDHSYEDIIYFAKEFNTKLLRAPPFYS